MNKKINVDVVSLALLIAIFPPIWAVLAPYLGIQTGAVALICAGVYVAGGNKCSNAVKMSIGFLLGDFWAWSVVKITDILGWNPDVELYVCLFVFGAAAVIISALLPKWIYCPAWLCGWAIGLTIMAPLGAGTVGNYPIQIGISMLVGVWYVGAFLDFIQNKMIRIWNNRKNNK